MPKEYYFFTEEYGLLFEFPLEFENDEEALANAKTILPGLKNKDVRVLVEIKADTGDVKS